MNSSTFYALPQHCPMQNSFQIILLFKFSWPKKEKSKGYFSVLSLLTRLGETLNIIFGNPNGRFWLMKSLSIVQKDWVQRRPMSVFKSGIEPWDSLSKGQILDHPRNNPCLSTEKSLSPLMIHLLIFFSFLMISQRSLMVPKDSPTLLSRKFHRRTLNRHSSGKSDNGPA